MRAMGWLVLGNGFPRKRVCEAENEMVLYHGRVLRLKSRIEKKKIRKSACTLGYITQT